MQSAPGPIVAWVEHVVGGRVVRSAPQGRWRPAWYLDVERDGEIVPLYFRGDRGSLDHGVYPLEHEQCVLEVLEAHGIPVPHVYGLCPQPRGIVMQRVAGRANLLTAATDDERARVLDDYMRWLARIHQIGAQPFVRAGLTPPAADPRLADFDRWEASYRDKKRRPEPLIEFVIGWLRRDRPRRSAAAALAVVTPVSSSSKTGGSPRSSTSSWRSSATRCMTSRACGCATLLNRWDRSRRRSPATKPRWERKSTTRPSTSTPCASRSARPCRSRT